MPFPVVFAVVFSVAVYGAAVAGVLLLGGSDRAWWRRLGRPWPVLTTSAVAVVGAVSTLQLVRFPTLRDHLGRDADAVRSGEVWRLVTSVTVQDGGWIGCGSNLVTLVLIGVVAERVLGRRRWLVAAVAPALLAEVVGLWWQPVSAGNSVVVAGLCGALASTALRRGPSVVPAAICATALVALAVTRDLNGAAGVAGLVVGGAMLVGTTRRVEAMTDSPADSTSTPDDQATDQGAEEKTGTSSGNPIAGVEISEDEKEHAVEPEDNSALEVDGPQVGHA